MSKIVNMFLSIFVMLNVNSIALAGEAESANQPPSWDRSGIGTETMKVVTIHGMAFPSSRYWLDSEPEYRSIGQVLYAEKSGEWTWYGHKVERFSLVVAMEHAGHGACCWHFDGNPNEDGSYSWSEQVVFYDGKFVTRGFDLELDFGKNHWLVVSEISDWVRIMDKEGQEVRTIFASNLDNDLEEEFSGRVQARFLSDGVNVLFKMGHCHTDKAIILYPVCSEYSGECYSYGWEDVPLPLANQGEYGELVVDNSESFGMGAIITAHGANRRHNVTMPDVFISDESLFYRAFYDRKSRTMYFGHTGGQVWEDFVYYGSRELPATKVANIVRYNFETKEHEVLYPNFEVKAAWSVDFETGSVIWWSPKVSGRRIEWREYTDGKATGRSFRTSLRKWQPYLESDGMVAMPVLMDGEVVDHRIKVR